MKTALKSPPNFNVSIDKLFTNSSNIPISLNNYENYSQYCLLENDINIENCIWKSLPAPDSVTVLTVNSSLVLSMWLKSSPNSLSSRLDSKSFTVDTISPSAGSITINSNASYTNSLTVSLSHSTTGVQEMYITQSSGCTNGGTWQNFNPSSSWDLENSNTNNDIFIKYKDEAGNESNCITSSIIHDNISPTDPSITNVGSAVDINSSADLTWTASTDADSGINEYQVQIHLTSDDSIIEAYTPLVSSNALTSLSSLEYLTGYYFKLRSLDNAGNYSNEITSSTWTSYNPPPQTQDDGSAVRVGSWSNYGDSNSWGNFRHWAYSGTGLKTITWSFESLVPGQYRISASYRAYSSQATNAVYTTYDDATIVGTASIDQKNSHPVDRDITGVMFDDIGTFTITSSTINVVLTDLANGEVTGDAIHIERVGN